MYIHKFSYNSRLFIGLLFLQGEQLAILAIPPDGHCMFRAIEDQLSRFPEKDDVSGPEDVAGLRAATANYMRAHPDDFMPFVTDIDSDRDMADQFETYCR